MRRTLRILPVAAAIAVAGMLIAAEAGEEHEGANEAPTMSLVITEKVRPSMTKQYEEATKEVCALLTDHGADPGAVGFWTCSGPEFGYTYVISMAAAPRPDLSYPTITAE